MERAIAFSRFGLGARPEDRIEGRPSAWLEAQLDRFDPRPSAFASLAPRATIATELADYFETQRAEAQRARPPANVMMAEPEGPANDPLASLPVSARRFIRGAGLNHHATMVAARVEASLGAPAPFVERMVHFWANHFAVSAEKLTIIGLAGLLEIEAVRSHVLGRFSDLLLAVEQHPAMLLYLDQAQSVGPGSQAARIAGRLRRPVGLNENLAREILELHTLGVGAGYTQADVGELSRAMTGWTVSGLTRGPGRRLVGSTGRPGDFHFADALHEPGERRLLGRVYRQSGAAQARDMLLDLAAHPATARHLATKIARHFAGDVPPPALVDRLTRVWTASGGDLAAVYRALIASPEPWTRQAARFRTPWDWSIAALRAVGARRLEPQRAVGLLTQLGAPVWRPGSPAGFDDLDASWAAPDALVRRVEAAERIAERAAGAVDPRALARHLLPDAISPATLDAIGRAESPAQGLALLLVSPEFLRR